MNLFQLGHFRLASGQFAAWKIDCEALAPADWRALAFLLVKRLPAFGEVEGVPRGGLPLASWLRPYKSSGPLLLVDDVFTTGASLERLRAGREALGAVVFARSPVAPWVTALFPMSPELGRSEECASSPPAVAG